MDNETMQRLISIPEAAKNYASDLSELDPEHIPRERVVEFKNIMKTSTNEYDKVWAARVLAEWGDDEGYDFLESYVCDGGQSDEVLMAHRLRGYDDVNTQILAAARRYWAVKATDSDIEGTKARTKIFKLMSHLIGLSNTMQFEIAGVFWLVDEFGMVEYLPPLKEHLRIIVQRPDFHHWKVADCAHFLMKFDPDFVTHTLTEYGKKLSDFPVK